MLSWRSNKVFAFFVVASLLVSVSISVVLVGHRADSILFKTQQNASNYEASYAITNLTQYIDNRYKVLKDIARSPLVANSVMGSEMQQANMADYLSDITILGSREPLRVLNILGEVIFPEPEESFQDNQDNYASFTWFEQMLAGELPVYIIISRKAGSHHFVLATPIVYNGYVEGVLMAEFSDSLESQFASKLKAGHAFRVATDETVYQNFKNDSNYQLITAINLDNSNLRAEYFIRSDYLDAEKHGFMRDIAIAIITSLVISFAILAALGKKLIVNPYKQLFLQEKRVRASEERFQLAVQGSKDGIWDWDIVQDRVYFSPRACEMLDLNYSATNSPSFSMEQWLSLMPSEDADKVRLVLQEHLQQDTAFDVECRLNNPEAELGYYRIKGCALRDESGKPIRMAGSLTDITEDKQAEQNLMEALRQNDLLVHAIEASPLGITIADASLPDMPLTYVNKGFLKLTGYEREEVIGRNCRFLQGIETDPVVLARIHQSIRNKTQHIEELLNYRKDGSTFWNNLHLSPIYDEQDSLIAYAGVQQDITERKEFENRLELSRIEAETANRTKSNFLASMSHEIRTPMNGVLGMLNLLKDEQLSSNQLQKVRIAINSARSLLSLINDILDFSKIEAGKMDLEKIEFDVRELFEDCVEGAAILVQDKDIELVLDTSGLKVEKAVGDPNRIRQVITNILGNAIKFTHQGQVIVSAEMMVTEQKQLRLMCRIKDSGVGIAADKIDSLFDSFTQIDASTTRKFGGTGLGLAIVKKLCNMMCGDVLATSKVGVGSTFEFWFTLQASDGLQESPSLLQAHSGKHVLVLDDCAAARTVVCKQLAYQGIKVVQSKSETHLQALLPDYQKKVSAHFDLMLLGDNIANIDGVSFYEKLEQFACLQNTPVILMSKLVDQNQLNHYVRLGISGFISKPVTTKDLLGALLLSEQDRGNSDGDLINARSLVSSEQSEGIATPTDLASDILSRRLLLVEDNEINQVVALSLLNKIGFKDVVVADNGARALEVLNKHGDEQPIELILMDCQMPEMDGYEASQKIRLADAGEKYKDIAIVAMTANAMRGDKQKCLEAGMSDYITKPVDEAQLQKALIKWLN